jgi:hypothetical protein
LMLIFRISLDDEILAFYCLGDCFGLFFPQKMRSFF